ncbi:MAG: 5-formyltetrahydrofolate cyclo-ligase, partial [Candidatus Auribacterota bacterium]|nr:5-formyltetrahydrofolate cyclo-ligase [Candidatus Auribacterota bacterium]
GRRLSTGDPDIIIVPGAAFDMGGKRIGMGKAYYDNFLRTVRPDTRKIALAFEKQIIDSIPSESHDVKMDLIITEKRVVYCG